MRKVPSAGIKVPKARSKRATAVKPAGQARLPKKSDLVVAIDFGTTYTGVAFGYDLPNAGSYLTPEQLRDKVTVLKSWPGVAGSYSDKVPSILAYDSTNGEVVAWGGTVNSAHRISVTLFKLGLEEGVGDYYSTGKNADTQSPIEQALQEEAWKHPKLPGKDAFHHTENFLGEIRKYVLTEALPKDFGQAFLSNVAIRYVLTIPAIWSDKAKDLTRKAATRVGIPKSDLTMISEPEAAALYCSTLCHETDLKDGDHFLVCDAGGGTVDLIAYELISRHPFKVRECTKGTGAACGAIFLTEHFKKLIVKKLASHAGILTPRMLEDAVNSFERNIKFTYNPYVQSHDGEYFEIPLPGAPDIPQAKLLDGYLSLSKKSVLKHVFMPVFSKISSLVLAQLEQVKELHSKELKTIFLVGGLGSNALLSSVLKSRLRHGLILQQPSGGHTAIMRGAVLSALGMQVQEHVLRRHYGSIIWRPFQFGDPTELHHRDLDGDVLCINAFHWYGRMNEPVPYGYEVEEPVEILCDQLEWNTAKVYPYEHYLWSSEEPQAPKYNWKVSGVKKIVALKVNLKTLPSSAVAKRVNSDGQPYCQVNFVLKIRFVTTLEFSMVWEGKVYKSVVAKYL